MTIENWIKDNGQSSLVSVIIPTYNRADLLKEAVQSVLNQGYRPIECIIVDDGSTDHTEEIIRKLKQLKDETFSLVYLKQQNSGSQTARNTGTRVSTGEFIQYLDSDDLLYKEKLVKQVNYLLEHPNCDAVFGDWEKGEKEKRDIVKGYANDDMMFQMLVQQPIHTLSILFRRNMVVKIGEWDTAIKRNQEIDFHIRGVLQGAVYHYQELTTGLWRTHSNERIANTTGLNDVVFFYQKMERLLKENQLFSNELKEKIALLYMWLISQHTDKPNNDLITMLGETIRLNPSISFYNNKMKWLTKLFGRKTALNIWLSWFRFNQKREKG